MKEKFWNVFGIILVLIGSISLFNLLIRLKKGLKITGIVVKNISNVSMYGSSLKMMFYPLVRIELKGRSKEIKLDNGTNPPIYKEGTSIKVLYYNEKLYPLGFGWVLLYVMFIISGIVTLILFNSF